MATLPIIVTLIPADDAGKETGAARSRVSLGHEGRYRLGKSDDSEIQLVGETLSRNHCVIEIDANGVRVIDEGSTNGVFIDGKRIKGAELDSGDRFSVPGYIIEVGFDAGVSDPIPAIDYNVTRTVGGSEARDAQTTLSFPANIFGTSEIIPVSEILGSGYPVKEIKYLAVGGGIGSFCWVDHLRVFGVVKEDILSVGLDPKCYSNYERYCKNSQIPRHERLRSNAISAPDNIWGFPGYASRETWGELKKGNLGGLKYMFQVFGEPALTESYTPRAGDVFESLDKEILRIGWHDMFIRARVVGMRKTNDGRYVIAIKEISDGQDIAQPERFILANFVHLSTGYPATRFVEDIQEFISKHPDQPQLVVNAYAPHDEIYSQAENSGADEFFVVRGRGIVASRIIQRLFEARKKNPKIKIVHSIRTPLASNAGAQYGRAKRIARGNVEIQPFNWPKSCWGGDLRFYVENASDEERGFLLNLLGGTSTAERSDWIGIVERGTEEGWYRPVFGNVTRLEPAPGAENEKIEIEITTPEGNKEIIQGDHLVDCTGLIADIKRSRFLDDLVGTYQIERNHAWRGKERGSMVKANPTGIKTNPHFEIEGLSNGNGRVYGSGTIVQGGPYLAVDSFLGLQYTALRSVDHLASIHAPGVSKFGGMRSFGQWLKWCRGVAP